MLRHMRTDYLFDEPRARAIVTRKDESGLKISGQDREPADSSRAVNFEISPVDREDTRDPFSLRGPNQGRVREIHREVAIFPHELAQSRDVSGVQRQDPDSVPFEEPPECLLRFRGEVEQVHGFRNHRPDGGERLPDSFESIPTRGVMAVVRVDEGHQGPCVDEDQERFRLRSRRSFRNRPPVRSERSGGPPRTDPMTPRKAS